uniref:Uncharacterized protein n=1 Tax=Rhizophora mucronata TaxID=61149 RepID=A0A2P2KFI2_RHIMU
MKKKKKKSKERQDRGAVR